MVFCCILQCFVAKSVCLQVTLFCREICFCTIYAVLRGEKLSQKLYPWRKNDKYEVWHPLAPTQKYFHTKLANSNLEYFSKLVGMFFQFVEFYPSLNDTHLLEKSATFVTNFS